MSDLYFVSEPIGQKAKADKGKIRPTLVPRQIIREIAKIRGFGCAKYKDPEIWREIEVERLRDAMCRHLLAYLDNPKGVDKESGLPHLSHLACNVAFLIEKELGGDNGGMYEGLPKAEE